MADIPKFKLSSGQEIPRIGLGTWESPKGVVAAAIVKAVEVGYRHLDFAKAYGNEKEIGEGIKQILSSGKVKREDLFITTKLFNIDHSPENVAKALRGSLADLNLTYVDLYLMHWPLAFVAGQIPKIEKVPVHVTWAAMEKLHEEGLAKNLGVSNFPCIMLHDLLSYAKVRPVVNQVELHPYNQQNVLVKWHEDIGVHLIAYSPLGRSGKVFGSVGKDGPVSLIENDVIKNIAVKHKKTPAQVLLRWNLSRSPNITIIPKTTNPDRLKENLSVFEFNLDQADLDAIGQLEKGYRYCNSLNWKIPVFY